MIDLPQSARPSRWTASVLVLAALAALAWWSVSSGLDQPTVSPKHPEPLSRLQDCAECPQLVVVPAGSFLMGSPESELGRRSVEGPQRRVQVDAFAIGRTEVTFAEYDRFAATTGRALPSDEGWGRGSLPVINVSWEDAGAYAQWLSAQTGQLYRLPSEAEWEYAARAGTKGPYSFDGVISLAKANYLSDDGSSGVVFWKQTVPGGSLPANPWGLHEVHGNVHEWVADCWQDDYQGAPTTGRAWTDGDCGHRVLRGGSWFSGPDWLRSACRLRTAPNARLNYVGFRLARTL